MPSPISEMTLITVQTRLVSKKGRSFTKYRYQLLKSSNTSYVSCMFHRFYVYVQSHSLKILCTFLAVIVCEITVSNSNDNTDSNIYNNDNNNDDIKDISNKNYYYSHS